VAQAAPTAADRGAGSSYPAPGYAWFCVAILIGTAILSYTDRQVLSLLVDPVRAALQVTDTQISLLLGTAFAVIYGVAGIPLGWLADRRSRRNLIFAGVIVWSLGTLACGFAASFTQLFLARVVVGLGESVLSPAAISLISDSFPPRRRGLAVGSFLSGIAIGSGASILIGGAALHAVQAGVWAGTVLANVTPWRLVLLLVGAPGLVWSLAILAIREPARQQSAASDASAERGGLAALRAAAPVYAVVAMASLLDNAVGAWSPTLIIRHFARDAAEVGLTLGLLLTIGFGIGVLVGGWLSDRAAQHPSGHGKLRVSLLAAVLILPVALAMTSDRYAVVMAAVPLYFLLSGAVTACGFSAILDAVPAAQRGLAMAVSFFLNVAIGAGVGPTAVALLSEHGFSGPGALGLALAVTTAAGCLINAVVLAWRMRTKALAPTA
jgi:MFS family permease